MTLKNKIKSNRGFSLMEFLIVVGILAVIAIIAIPITVGIINSSNKQNDEVLASTYSEYMQKFATEQTGSIGFYPTLKDDSVGSDYDVLKNSAGKGSFPGITQLDSRINEASEEEIWNLIRKEACIAISAFSGKELADPYNYFVEKPTDSKMAFVYYYLTGTVALKPVEEMENSKATIQQVNDGAVDTEDYWVYLDRKGGSGKAASDGPSSGLVRDFYVKVVQFGTDMPLGGAKVTISPYGSSVGTSRTATTNEEGFLVFRDVYLHIDTAATKLGALDWWSEEHYSEFEHIANLELHPDLGTLANPFKITLKMGTLGSLEFFEQYKTYSYNPSGTSFVTRTEKIDWYNDFTTDFKVKDDSPTGIDETYNSEATEHNPLELLGDQNKDGDFCFLIYGDYTMTITNHTLNTNTKKNPYGPNFATYTEDITSDVWGIYNTNNPKEYPNATSPYPYPVVLKREDTLIQGQIMAEIKDQPLHGTKNGLFTSYNGSNQTKNVTISTYVYAVNVNNRSEYYTSEILSNPKTVDNNYVYDFSLYLEGQHSGNKDFELFLVTIYGEKDTVSVTGQTIERMNVAAFPATIKADGSIYELKTSTKDYVKVNLESDVGTASSVNIKVYEKRNGFNRYLDCTAILKRVGYTSHNSYTKYEGHVEENTAGTYISLNNVKQGFYTLTIDYHDVYGDSYPEIIDVPVIIDDSNDIIIELSPVNIDYEITIHPITQGGADITPDIDLLSANASRNWEQISVNVSVGGVNLKDKGITVSVDATTPTANKAKVTFSYGRTTKGLVLTQSVKCFDSSASLNLSGSIGQGQTKYTNTLKIKRLETESTSTNDHVGFGNWDWKNTTDGKHYEECYRCKYDRKMANHYVEKNISNGTLSAADKYIIYSNGSAQTSNNNGVNKQHYKHCTVCNIYDDATNCSGGSWTWEYNQFINNSAHSSTHTNASGYTLKKNSADAISTSTTYHYKYCSTCHGRYDVQEHKMNNVDTPATCTTAGYNKCDDLCGYEVEVPALGHLEDSSWYYIGTISNCCVKVTTTKCTRPGCTYVSANGKQSVVYGHTHDVADNNMSPYNNPCGGLFFRHPHHALDDRHGSPCHSLTYGWWYDGNGTGFMNEIYKSDGTYEPLTAENANEYMSAPGEWGYFRLSSSSSYLGTTRYDGLQYKVMAKFRYYESNESWKHGWRIYGPTGGLDLMYYYSNGDGSVANKPAGNSNNGSVVDGRGYAVLQQNDDSGKRVNAVQANKYICKMGFCCRQFRWPTDATAPSSWDNAHAGKYMYCIGHTAYQHYGG